MPVITAMIESIDEFLSSVREADVEQDKGREVAAIFFEVLTCGRHTGWVSMKVQQLPDDRDEDDR